MTCRPPDTLNLKTPAEVIIPLYSMSTWTYETHVADLLQLKLHLLNQLDKINTQMKPTIATIWYSNSEAGCDSNHQISCILLKYQCLAGHKSWIQIPSPSTAFLWKTSFMCILACRFDKYLNSRITKNIIANGKLVLTVHKIMLMIWSRDQSNNHKWMATNLLHCSLQYI
jgi:hypothetical protein